MRTVVALLVAVLVAGAAALDPAPLPAQEDARVLQVVEPDGARWTIPLVARHGHAALPASALSELGWSAEPASGDPDGTWVLRSGAEAGPGGGIAEVRLTPGVPLFTWNGELQQLVGTPRLDDGELWVPVQLVVDFFPVHLPSRWRTRPAAREGAPVLVRLAPPPSAAGPGVPRVVVIDPGHGGRDTGAIGPAGTREKDVALALARALARELERHPGLEVHLTRDEDVLVPLWRRGEWATEVKGDRPGIFLSIHANALPDRSTTRGFETYFLSEARSDHERRVAAIENAPLELERREVGEAGESGSEVASDLDFILKDLRNRDHLHWSRELAWTIQRKMAPVHPGPDRGVKQAPFAVITNALMPAVLVEVGFLSHREEERLLVRETFHRDVAGAVAGAVVDFFRRYPPEQGVDVTAAVPATEARP